MSEAEPRNYYGQQNNSDEGLKFRLGSDDVIIKVCDTLQGIERDLYGKRISTIEYEERHRLLNEIGIHRVKVFLGGLSNKITHLTKYESNYETNAQIRALAKVWAFEIAINKKSWSIEDKDIVMQVIENVIQQSIRRGLHGFENENISKNYLVHHQIKSKDSGDDEGASGVNSLRLMDKFGGRR